MYKIRRFSNTMRGCWVSFLHFYAYHWAFTPARRSDIERVDIIALPPEESHSVTRFFNPYSLQQMALCQCAFKQSF